MKSLFSLVLLLIIIIASCAVQSFAEVEQPAPVHPTQYRGFTVSDMDYETLRDAAQDWGANQLRYMIAPVWQKGSFSSYVAAFDAKVANLPEQLKVAKEFGHSIVVDLHQIPNDNPKVFAEGVTFADDMEAWKATTDLYWSDPNNLRILKECWCKLAKVTAQYPDMDLWLELLNEPLDWNSFPNCSSVWLDWAEQTILEIRQIDKVHPILFASGPGALSWGMKDLEPIKDPCNNVIYTIHMWQPHGYTLQGINGTKLLSWPGISPGDSNKMWDKAELLNDLKGAIDFQKEHNVRIHVGEFGVARYAPGRVQFLQDTLDIIEGFGWDWNYHAFRESLVWSLEHGSEITLYKELEDGTKEEMTTVITPEIIAEKEKYTYQSYGVGERGCKAITVSDERGQLVKKYMSKNQRNVPVKSGEAQADIQK